MSEAVGVIPPNRYGHRGKFVCLLKALKVIFHFLVVGEILFKDTSVINGYEPSHSILCLDVPFKVKYRNRLVQQSPKRHARASKSLLAILYKGGLFVFEVFKRFFHVLSS